MRHFDTKMLGVVRGVVLVILFAHTINGQLSCNMTILADFPGCMQAFLGAGNVTDNETINLLCAANGSECQTTIASFVNSCNATDQEVSFRLSKPAIKWLAY